MRGEAGRSCDRQLKCELGSIMTMFRFLAPLTNRWYSWLVKIFYNPRDKWNLPKFVRETGSRPLLCYPHHGMAKVQICYVGTQFPLYLWDTPQLRYMYLKVNTRKNTYGTYFSCPSLEISSTSLSRRLSIAMSTSKRVAILKGSSEPLMRTIFIEDLTQWYHGLSHLSVQNNGPKTTWWNDRCLRRLALLEVSFRQIGSFNPLFHEKNHMPSVFRRFLRDSFYFQFPMLKIRTFYLDAGQLVSAAFNPDIFPPFKEILKILSPHPLSYVYIQWEYFYVFCRLIY